MLNLVLDAMGGRLGAAMAERMNDRQARRLRERIEEGAPFAVPCSLRYSDESWSRWRRGRLIEREAQLVFQPHFGSGAEEQLLPPGAVRVLHVGEPAAEGGTAHSRDSVVARIEVQGLRMDLVLPEWSVPRLHEMAAEAARMEKPHP
ncbi:hypothetical protein NMG29_34700 [Streptomyces cocklensis]|uniref:Uncharacterized protein n=1 Tax=Actinacidiphila cocklensis TaxID=887465 RepID=A0A9W4DPK1_9ACTN|nr:hypothetical protein [Actinacidiphila cocklensis]MDD1063263.1 hypothetical protein [Actinacidiphila cocklensis]WSX74431.1 hypothetical protein OH826_11475 [Streptomyces sp. NBC_00899]CAG6393704.1 hypothetical protein SCOCK_210144 [Actinacidiphila cocklensis]